MKKSLKHIVNDVVPPIALAAYRKRRAAFGFSGNYATWEDARRESTGYDEAAIFAKVRDSSLTVKEGKAAYERDSVVFAKIEYEWHLLASLFWITSRSNNTLKVIDFGGSLGSLYYQHRGFLQHISELRWTVVEQKQFVECGKADFEDNHLTFEESLGNTITAPGVSTILLSSVLQYIPEPYSLLRTILDSSIRFIIIDKTPLIEGPTDRLTVQKVYEPIYEASYPAWFLSEQKVLDLILKQFSIVAEFERMEVVNSPAKYRGFLFERKTK